MNILSAGRAARGAARSPRRSAAPAGRRAPARRSSPRAPTRSAPPSAAPSPSAWSSPRPGRASRRAGARRWSSPTRRNPRSSSTPPAAATSCSPSSSSRRCSPPGSATTRAGWARPPRAPRRPCSGLLQRGGRQRQGAALHAALLARHRSRRGAATTPASSARSACPGRRPTRRGSSSGCRSPGARDRGRATLPRLVGDHEARARRARRRRLLVPPGYRMDLERLLALQPAPRPGRRAGLTAGAGTLFRPESVRHEAGAGERKRPCGARRCASAPYSRETFRVGSPCGRLAPGTVPPRTTRSPGGLSRRARPARAGAPPAAQRLLASARDFRVDGACRRGRQKRLRLAGAGAPLDDFLVLAAGLLGGLADAQGAAARGPPRGVWRDLLGAPTIVGVSPAARALRAALPARPTAGSRSSSTASRGAGAAPRRGHPPRSARARDGPSSPRTSPCPGVAPGGRALRRRGAARACSPRPRAGPSTSPASSCSPPAAQERLLDVPGRRRGDAAGAPAAPDHRRAAATSTRPCAAAGSAATWRPAARPARSAVPPLRERPEDIPLIAEHLLRRRAAAHGTPAPALAPETLEALKITLGW